MYRARFYTHTVARCTIGTHPSYRKPFTLTVTTQYLNSLKYSVSLNFFRVFLSRKPPLRTIIDSRRGTMAQLLSIMSKDERFHTPRRPNLRQGVQNDLNGTLLTQAQLLALTLNELCVLQGKGLFAWLPNYAHNVTVLPYDEEP